MSRLWVGIHFRSDIDAGPARGRAVAGVIAQRVQHDGA
jgi:hypothetical protein